MTKQEVEDKALKIAIRTFFYEAAGKEQEIYDWLEKIESEDKWQLGSPYRIKASLYHLDFCDFWFHINHIIKLTVEEFWGKP